MKHSWVARHPIMTAALLGCLVGGTVIAWRFDHDIKAAFRHVSVGSRVVTTPCGPIEYQEAGSGIPLLAVHGSGGGFDQGMAFAEPLTKRGIKVIAMSRFGYLRTPMPFDASARAQADAHVCLLDALGIKTAAIMGGSAGAPSALKMAISHPDRVSALILLAPLAYKPPTQAISAKPMAPWVESIMMKVIASDFVFWAATHVARDAVISTVLATPPDVVKSASAPEQARIYEMMRNILPVSARAAGLRSDSAVGKALGPSPLEQVHAPTLIIAARDDGYGTFASAQYTANGIAGANFLGFETGGHTWVGHNDEVMDAIARVVSPTKNEHTP
jgi:2-hydroxy-6-oxonona-2,4-dienedioate hydrolase